jgi:putative transposase
LLIYQLVRRLHETYPPSYLYRRIQAWRASKVVPERKLDELRLDVVIKDAHQRGRGIYGPKKIQSELSGMGIVAVLNRIKRLRTLHGIRCTHKKKFRC